jgi:hypothetical protein
MERSGRLVMGALLVALVPALLASSPATAAEHDGPDERAAARIDAMANALSKAARLRATSMRTGTSRSRPARRSSSARRAS